MSSSKVSVSPSFKGNITNIMRQRQLFLEATRADGSSSHSKNGVLTRLWKRVSMLVPGRKGVSVGVGVAIGLAISTQLPNAGLRCIPQSLYSHSSSSSSSSSSSYAYAWTAIGRAALDKLIAVNSLVLMGLTSTVISAVILSAFRPFGSLRCCRTTTDSAESGSESGSGSGSGSVSDDTTFDSSFYEEYDTMMSSSTETVCEPASFSAVPVTTPRCELVITYVPARSAFGYYTDRKDSIPYSHLETAARMFLVKNARPDLAKLAYVDRRRPSNSAVLSSAVSAVPSAGVPDDIVSTPSTSGGGIFAMFKSYNRKPATAAAAATSDSTTASNSGAAAVAAVAPATDTHFVYMGTMQDYKATRDKSKRSPTSRSSGSGEETPYVNVKYTEFKSRSKL
jgi:hypothetical protein